MGVAGSLPVRVGQSAVTALGLPEPDMPAQVGFERILDDLGRAIADGRLASGQVVLLEAVEQRFGVSRNIAREAVRILGTLGMVTMKRRVGCIVRPRSDWLVSDPRVIRWRIAGSHQLEELDQLMQLRAAIEPVAARLAVAAATDAQVAEVTRAAQVMRVEASEGRGHSEAFMSADVVFHAALVRASGNDHFASLAGVIATVLTERLRIGLLDAHPDPRAVALHDAVADALVTRDADRAEASARALIDLVSAEVLTPTPTASPVSSSVQHSSSARGVRHV